MDENSNNGVKINLISSRKLDSMTSEEKLRFILDQVKNGVVLVLERGLSAVEEIDLIKSTMSEIDHETFIGIEMQSYSADDLATASWFSRVLGRTRVPKMSVIGPANLLKTIQKNGNIIQAMILTGKSISQDVPNTGDIDTLKPEGDKEVPGEVVEGEPGIPGEPNGLVAPEQPDQPEELVQLQQPPAPTEPVGPVESGELGEGGEPPQSTQPEPMTPPIPPQDGYEQVNSYQPPADSVEESGMVGYESGQESLNSTPPNSEYTTEQSNYSSTNQVQTPPATQAPQEPLNNTYTTSEGITQQPEQEFTPPSEPVSEGPSELAPAPDTTPETAPVPAPEDVPAPPPEPTDAESPQGTGFLYKRLKEEEE